MMKNITTPTTAITFLLLILASCGENDLEEIKEIEEIDLSGILNVTMTSASFPVEQLAEANIVITKIEIRQSGSEEEDPFVTIFESDLATDLLKITNGVYEDLASVEIPKGSYDLVRIYISEATLVLNDDENTTYDLKVPGGSSSGLKIFINPDIVVEGGLSAELLLDLDVSKSFVRQGPPNAIKGFIFKPVVQAINESFAGRLIGKVSISEESDVTEAIAKISVYAADTLNKTTYTDTEGNYEIPGLYAGLYDITVEADGFTSETSTDVEIVAANATTTDFDLSTQE